MPESSENSSNESTRLYAQLNYRHGLRQYGGLNMLVQGTQITNPYGIKIKHTLSPAKGSPPHRFRVPSTFEDPLPDYTSDPLFQVLKPGVEPGVYHLQCRNQNFIMAWLSLYGEGDPPILWLWGKSTLTIPNIMIFQTNMVPILVVGLEHHHLGNALYAARSLRNAGRRAIFFSSRMVPLIPGTIRLTTKLDDQPTPPASELAALGNHFATKTLLEAA